MSDRSVVGSDPDYVWRCLAPGENADRDVTFYDVVMLASAALALVFASGLLVLGF